MEQPGLAHAGFANDLDHAGLTDPCSLGDLEHNRQLGLSAVHRATGPVDGWRALGEAEDARRVKWGGLALDHERRNVFHSEPRLATTHDVTRRDEFVRSRVRHHTRGRVYDIAHHRVCAPESRADLAGEHMAAVDADTHIEAQIRVEDVEGREQHSIFLAFPGSGRATDKNHLAAVLVDVGREKRDAVFGRRPFATRDEAPEGSARSRSPRREPPCRCRRNGGMRR